MEITFRSTSNNVLVSSPYYAEIITEYAKRVRESGKGKINAGKFYHEFIAPRMPDYSVTAWYYYLRRFSKQIGVENVEKHLTILKPKDPAAFGVGKSDGDAAQDLLATTLLENKAATAKGINIALNLGTAFIEKLYERYLADPNSLSAQEQRMVSDFLFKSMKAQDSRIHAIGKIREDNREEERMQRAFNEADYG